MNTIIFFDLEQTLIPDWTEDRETLIPLVHVCLRDWIFDQFPFTAGLLSFAVWNDADVIEFNKEIRPMIEEHLHFKFSDEWIITRDEVKDWMNLWNHTPFMDADDNASTFKKEGIMTAIWKHKFKEPNTRIILLDDTVEDMVITRTGVENNSLHFVNPWTIITQ